MLSLPVRDDTLLRDLEERINARYAAYLNDRLRTGSPILSLPRIVNLEYADGENYHLARVSERKGHDDDLLLCFVADGRDTGARLRASDEEECEDGLIKHHHYVNRRGSVRIEVDVGEGRNTPVLLSIRVVAKNGLVVQRPYLFVKLR